jgi:hypothetical protein
LFVGVGKNDFFQRQRWGFSRTIAKKRSEKKERKMTAKNDSEKK